MATISKIENMKTRQISPSDVSPEGLLVACLLERIQKLPAESLQDMVELFEIYTKPETSGEEQYEIYETLREILFPQLSGTVRTINPAEQIPSKLQSRADWIGKKVEEYRNKKDLTQTQLAEKSGLQQSQISRLEAGEHSPSFKTLEKIAKVLDVLVGDLDPSHS